MKVQPREKSNLPGSCYRCGRGDLSDSCRFRDSECHYCHKRRGHIVKKCPKNRQTQNVQVSHNLSHRL